MASTMFTPMRSQFPAQATPKKSERKRALFPTSSPQTSDLGHMSPLGSSPDRYSSAPASPDSQYCSPIKGKAGSASPFGRKHRFVNDLQQVSPRRRFTELLGRDLPVFGSSRIKSSYSPHSQHSQASWSKNIVPADQLEQTVLSVMDDSDCCADSPSSHTSQHTPSSTPHGTSISKAPLEVKHTHPLTPSKRRSRCMPISGSGSTTSTSPQSPKKQRRLSLDAKSKSAELPRARLSLFSEYPNSKRERKDCIYLTGRSSKSRKTFGQINAGVRTGIRRPSKVKPKKAKAEKQSTRKRKGSPISLPKMSLAPKQVKLSDADLKNFSASSSLQVRDKKRNAFQDEENEENVELMEEETKEPNTAYRFFKTKAAKKKRVATITVNKNVKITFSNGKFTLNRNETADTPTPKRRRKLFDLEKQRKEMNTFEDHDEDVADCARKEVMVILKKLDEDVSPSSCQAHSDAHKDSSDKVILSSPEDLLIAKERSNPASPLSPLSELASSTSTLSLNIGGDTLHLKESQLQALSQIPDFIMEEDDMVPSTQPLTDSFDDNETSLMGSNLVTGEMKENEAHIANSQETSPLKYFPIFNCKSQDETYPEKLSSSSVKKRKRTTWHPIGNDQYQIDAGQKRFGATQCSECHVIYQLGDPEDEILHSEVHNSFKFLKFAGWKKENVVGKFGPDRVIVVKPGDSKLWWSKALQVIQIVDDSLGFASGSLDSIQNHTLTYLYVSGKHIVGCLVAQPLKIANRMLLSESETGGIDCCSKEEYPVKCGVSRIWVHSEYRRRNIASNLMDCMRKTFLFGSCLSLEDIAFSSPTTSGKLFAEKYTGRNDYFVYLQVQ